MYHRDVKESLFGKCTWFSKYKKEPDKEIPADVVDKGCKYWKFNPNAENGCDRLI